MLTRIDMPILSRGHQRILTSAFGDETGNTFCAGVPPINGKRPALAESGLDIDNDQCAAHEELLKRGNDASNLVAKRRKGGMGRFD